MSWKDTIKKAQVDVEAIDKMIKYFNNTRPYEEVGKLFGQDYDDMEDHRKDYVEKFIDAWRNPIKLWGMLDSEKQEMLVELINIR